MRARRSAAGAAGAALCLALVSAGCSGSTDDASGARSTASPTASASTTSSPTATASATTTPAAQRAPRAPKAANTKAGRLAYARFVMDTWTYSVRTNDARAMSRLSRKGKPCQGCRDLATALAKRKKQGWYVDFPGLELRRQKVVKLDPLTYVVRSTVDIPQSQSLNDDGSFRNASKAHRGATFEVAMMPSGGGYKLLAFSID